MPVDLLARLERAVEHLFEGLFSSRFRGRVHPVEIARRLTRAIEDHRLVSVSQVFAPNEFTVALHPEDYATIAPFEAAVIPELAQHVESTAAEENYGLLGKVLVSLQEDPAIDRGDMRIDARFVRKEDQARRVPDRPTTALSPEMAPSAAPSEQQATLRVVDGPDAGEEFALTRTITTIGRGGANDVALTDSSVSRAHARIQLQPDGFHLQDLDSKNGSLVNGHPAVNTLLADGDTITIAGTVFQFRAARIL